MSMTNDQAQATLAPFVEKYKKTLNDGLFDQMGQFYHKNSVMIETDKSVLWGRKDIQASLEQMTTEFGNTKMELSNSQYQGVGEFIHIETDFAFHTEKAGVLQGHFLQIWRKDGDVYTIYHDEYKMI